MKQAMNIGLQPNTRALRLVRVADTGKDIDDGSCWHNRDGYWIIWINTVDFIHGTFLKLYDDGKLERVTVREGEPCDDVQLIKPEDG